MRVASLVLSSVIALAVLSGAAPAGAHGETANLSLDAMARGDAMVEVQVALSYADDGHPVEGAEVTASATGPGGGAAGPVTLASIGLGGYRGELPTPAAGTWTVRAESADPVASAETTVEVAASGASDTPDTPDTPDPEDTAPGDAPGRTVGGGGDEGQDEDGSSSDAVPWVVAGVVVAVVVGAGVMLLRRRHG
jgi:hypothetical protein